MKKLIAILFVICTLICAVIFEENTINNYLSEIKQKTQNIIEICADKNNIQTKEIIDAVSDLKQTWIHHENVLTFFANHKDMRDLCVEIQKLQGNIEVNQYEDFTSGLKVILHLTQEYQTLLGTSWQNIF